MPDPVGVVSLASFVVAWALALASYARRRDRIRGEILAFFTTFVGLMGYYLVGELTGLTSRPIMEAARALLLFEPIILLLLVGHLRPVPLRVRRAAWAGTLGSLFLVLAFPRLPLPVLTPVVLQFAALNAWAALAMLRTATRRGGLGRRRLTLAAGGILSFAFIVIVLPVKPLAPALVQTLQDAGIAAAAAGLFLGFAPPLPLRRAWQRREVERFARKAAGGHGLAHLPDAAARAIDGAAAVVVRRERDGFALGPHRTEPALEGHIRDEIGVLVRAWARQSPEVALSAFRMSHDERRLAEAVGASALVAVPVAHDHGPQGVLLVFPRREPLFPEHDLDVLAALARQAAVPRPIAAG